MSNLVEIAVFPSRLEAEAIGHALDQHGIPFLVQSHDVGMFGPGMVGFTPGGASLQVPEERFEEVQELLTCVVQPIPEGFLPAELAEDELHGEAPGDAGPEAAPSVDQPGD